MKFRIGDVVEIIHGMESNKLGEVIYYNEKNGVYTLKEANGTTIGKPENWIELVWREGE